MTWFLLKIKPDNIGADEVADVLADYFQIASIHMEVIPEGEIKHYVDNEDVCICEAVGEISGFLSLAPSCPVHGLLDNTGDSAVHSDPS